MNKKAAFLFSALLLCALVFPSISQANNLTISNVKIGQRDPSAKTLAVLFDLSWENSWRNKINHDAVWMNVRLNDTQASPVDKRLCHLSVTGLNPSGSSGGNGSIFDISVPQDKAGAFVRRSSNGEVGTVSSQNMMLTVDYSSCGFSENSQIAVTLFGLEMVFVPEGSFYAGDFSTSEASLRQGSADVGPWSITGSSAINVSGIAAGGYYYVSAGNVGETGTGSSFVVPQDFPKGYSSFYAMKYEITEEQWVGFLNSLPNDASRAAHDLTNNLHKNTDAVISRNTISCSGSSLVCTTQRPSRAVTFLSWNDLSAFLDWSGLRPMTELEFEKAARGPFVPVKGEYAWSSTDITAATTISGVAEEGEEVVANTLANANFYSTTLSGGDAVNGPEYQSGPLRTGIFATSVSDRIISGAGNYGTMELSGNVKEWIVTIGNADGLAFTGIHGDGYLITAVGAEGNANVSGWPGMDVDVSRGVTGSSGAGFRGGSWSDPADRLHIADRQEAASGATDALATYGGRGVRTSDGK